MKVYFDTSVLVAASVADHPNYLQASASLRADRGKNIQGYISAHGMAEILLGTHENSLHSTDLS